MFCGMDRIPDGFNPFSPTENAFPNSLINTSDFRDLDHLCLSLKCDHTF